MLETSKEIPRIKAAVVAKGYPPEVCMFLEGQAVEHIEAAAKLLGDYKECISVCDTEPNLEVHALHCTNIKTTVAEVSKAFDKFVKSTMAEMKNLAV